MRELRFVRFDPEVGTPAAEQQLVLSGARPAVEGRPAIDWNDEEVGVLYADEGVDGTSVYFVSVDPVQGTASTPAKVSGDGDARSPALAWSGRTWGGVWSESSGGSDLLQLSLISPSGDVDLSAPVSPGGEDATSGAIAWGADGFGIAWIAESGGAWLQIVSEDGGFQGEAVDVSEGFGTGTRVDVTATDDGFVVAWEQFVGGETEIFVAAVDGTGTVTIPALEIEDSSDGGFSPALATASPEVGLAWSNGLDVFVLRLSPELEPQGRAARLSRGADATATEPTLTWSDDRFRWGLVWQDARLPTDLDVWFNELGCD